MSQLISSCAWLLNLTQAWVDDLANIAGAVVADHRMLIASFSL
jgi:hypothetical protein